MKHWPIHLWHEVTMLTAPIAVYAVVAALIGLMSTGLAVAYVNGFRENRAQAWAHCVVFRGVWVEGPLYFFCAWARR